AEVGLLTVEFARRTGRTGPGAGRPAKLYRRSDTAIAVQLPERSYEVAGQLLAEAVDEAEATGESPRTVLRRRAGEFGRALGVDTEPTDDGVLATLGRCGYEPRTDGDDIVLANCPFHDLAARHTQLVCGMNLGLVTGLLEGANCADRQARLVPHEQHCCVRIERAG
ncbi:MAG: transcriptional regulator, partial [Propionibacteriales bacterium]|nr:transcriptional regulator [Propionibacteriales bacterium]